MAFQRQAASIILALVARRGIKLKLLKLFLKYGQSRCCSEEIFSSNGSKVTKGAWHLRMMTASVVMSYLSMSDVMFTVWSYVGGVRFSQKYQVSSFKSFS